MTQITNDNIKTSLFIAKTCQYISVLCYFNWQVINHTLIEVDFSSKEWKRV